MSDAEDGCTPVESPLYEAQKYVERRLEQKWLPLFTASPEFIARQRPDVSIGHVVDDVIANHRRRNVQAVQRVSCTDNPIIVPRLSDIYLLTNIFYVNFNLENLIY